MQNKHSIERIKAELEEGIKLTKCKKCGCMKESLGALRNPLSSLQTNDSLDLLRNIEHWLKQMQPIEYACLGCEYCFPAVAMNIYNEAFSETAQSQSLSCAFEVREQDWPPVPGEYFAFCESRDCPVAVSTLASVELAEELAGIRPKELCIVGKTETENIGVDKIIKNTITNPTIHFLILAGRDPKGHYTGKTLLALRENGVDDNMRVIGSPGKRPFLRNVTLEEVESFRKQVQVVDLIGIEDIETIVQKIKEISKGSGITCSCEECHKKTEPVNILEMPVIRAEKPTKVDMDKAGYFVVVPQKEKGEILVEHYSYDNKLQRAIEGKDARTIYWTIIENGWVTQLSHAAYLGKELSKAELSIKYVFRYTQDGA